MDLAGLAETGQLLVGGLSRDDCGIVGAQAIQTHRETATVDRVELHEADPGFVKQDIVAERPEFLDDGLGAVDRSVVAALFDHGDTEGPLPPPWLGVGDQGMVPDFLADLFFTVVSRERRSVYVSIS